MASFGPRRYEPKLASRSHQSVDASMRASRITGSFASGLSVDHSELATGSLLQEVPVGAASGASAPVTELPPHLWRVAIADGQMDQLRAVAPLPDGRVVAAFRKSQSGTGPSVDVCDMQMTRQAGPSLIAPVPEEHGSSRLKTTCTALRVVSPTTIWCGWNTGHVSCYSCTGSCELLDTLYAHRGSIVEIASSCRADDDAATPPNHTRVVRPSVAVTTATDNGVTIWDVDSRQALRSVTPSAVLGQPRVAECIGHLALVGYESGTIATYTAGDGGDDGQASGFPRLTAHKSAVTAMAAGLARAASTAVLWTGDDDGSIRLHVAVDLPATASSSSTSAAPSTTLRLEYGRVTAVAESRHVDVLSRAAHRTRAAILGTASGRLVGVRAVDQENTLLTLLFVFDMRAFSPATKSLRQRGDGMDYGGSVSAVTGVTPLSPSSVVVCLASGAAVAIVAGSHRGGSADEPSTTHLDVNASSAIATAVGAPDYSHSQRDYEALEGRYERLLRRMHTVARRSKEGVLKFKLEAENALLAVRHLTARNEDVEHQCGLLAEALEKTVAELTTVKHRAAELTAAENRLVDDARSTGRTLRTWEAKCLEQRDQLDKQHTVLESLRSERATVTRERDELSTRLDRALADARQAEQQLEEARATADDAAIARDAARKRAQNAELRADESESALREAVAQLRAATQECHAMEKALLEGDEKLRTSQRVSSEATVELAWMRETLAKTKLQLEAKEQEATALRHAFRGVGQPIEESTSIVGGSLTDAERRELTERVAELERDNFRHRAAVVDRELAAVSSAMSPQQAGRSTPPPRDHAEAEDRRISPRRPAVGVRPRGVPEGTPEVAPLSSPPPPTGETSTVAVPGGAAADASTTSTSALDVLAQARRLMERRRTHSPLQNRAQHVEDDPEGERAGQDAVHVSVDLSKP